MFDKHELICLNGEALAESENMFRLFITSFKIQRRQIMNGQAVASASINHACHVRSTLAKQKFLGILDKRLETGKE